MSTTEDVYEQPDWFEFVYAVIRKVPAGRIVTYGQVADLVSGLSVTARQVGAALRFAPSDVPWQRVIGAGGRLPIAKRSPELSALQQQLLKSEGVAFVAGSTDRIDILTARWIPESESENYGQMESLPF